jgi:hypothetical protein
MISGLPSRLANAAVWFSSGDLSPLRHFGTAARDTFSLRAASTSFLIDAFVLSFVKIKVWSRLSKRALGC